MPFGPSMLRPTRKPCALKKRAHSSLRSIPLVWIVCMIFWPGFLYFATRSIERRKNSRPIKVGSPPCHATLISEFGCAASSCRSEEHTSELQSHLNLVCPLLLVKKNKNKT